MAKQQSAKPASPGHFFVKVLADQHYQKGVQYEQQGDWEHALEAYRRASSYDANNVLFLLARGHICQAHGLEAEAEECYRLALRVRPGDPVVLYNQAQLFAARGELDRARANLMKIAAKDVKALGVRAAPILCRLGDLALRSEEYATAAKYFEKALDIAPEHRYASAALAGTPRFAEFPKPFGDDGRIAPKIAVYGYLGAVLLGMPEDDGIDVPAYPGLGFETLHELAQALARFVGLARRSGWTFEAVVALDAESQPLAIALAAALDAHPVGDLGSLNRVPRGSGVLGVTATGADVAGLEERLRTLERRGARTLYYAVGLMHPIWEYQPPPHVVTAPVQLEFPWNRREAAALEHAEAYGTELAALLKDTLLDGKTDVQVEAQLAWYGAHRRVSVALNSAFSARV